MSVNRVGVDNRKGTAVAKLLHEFTRPGPAFRGKPFWSWNDTIEPGEVRRQIRVMKEMGLGGFFIHSRTGLRTPYLSPAWFAAVAAAVDEARSCGLEAWIYDEDLWPSGTAGGKAVRNPLQRMQAVVLTVHTRVPPAPWSDDAVAAFVADGVDGGTLRTYRRLAPGVTVPRLRAGQRLLLFRTRQGGYVDTLNPQAVKRFITVTHEAYRQRFERDFGRTIPGFFSDECHRGDMVQPLGEGWTIPWTPRLPVAFRRRYGYDLLDRLPEVFFDGGGSGGRRARLDFHDCVQHLFTDAYARQIGAWCGKHGVQFTGHILWEELLSTQTRVVGSCMRFYEHMQAPGMDILTEYTRYYALAKQVSSVARQCGRRWRLTEIYGCTGWDFPFAGHKAVGDWQTALGINLRCQHLSMYSMAGNRKRDFPASILDQSPWWRLYPLVEDYFARVHAVMTRGAEARDLLVLHPIESAWATCRIGWWDSVEMRRLDTEFIGLADALLAAHLDFDYGDEEMLARLACVTRRGGRPVLCVGPAVYTTVLVPRLITVRRSTLALLRQFLDAGGTVFFAGDAPLLVGGERSEEAVELARRCQSVVARLSVLRRQLAPHCGRVSIAAPGQIEAAGVLYLLREDRAAQYLFICNTGFSRKQACCDIYAAPRVRDRKTGYPELAVSVRSSMGGRPIELDPVTGETFLADASHMADGWTLHTSLLPLASRLFVLPATDVRSVTEPCPCLQIVSRRRVAPPQWRVRLSEQNCLLLDLPRWRLDGGDWHAAGYVLSADDQVRDVLAIPRRNPWVQPWNFRPPPTARHGHLELEYIIAVREYPRGALYIALERPELYTIQLNGCGIDSSRDAGWWVDRTTRRVPVDPRLFRRGSNTLTLSCDYDVAHPGLEVFHLLGDFGVRLEGRRRPVLVAAPDGLRVGDWTRQSLPFYGGTVVYETTLRLKVRGGDRVFLAGLDYRGSCVRVWVAGEEAGVTAWPPHEVELTRSVAGRTSVRLGIEVVGHRGNSHGPLHFKAPWPYAIGNSGSFEPGPANWSDDYQLIPCGLRQPPRLEIRRGPARVSGKEAEQA